MVCLLLEETMCNCNEIPLCNLCHYNAIPNIGYLWRKERFILASSSRVEKQDQSASLRQACAKGKHHGREHAIADCLQLLLHFIQKCFQLHYLIFPPLCLCDVVLHPNIAGTRFSSQKFHSVFKVYVLSEVPSSVKHFPFTPEKYKTFLFWKRHTHVVPLFKHLF